MIHDDMFAPCHYIMLFDNIVIDTDIIPSKGRAARLMLRNAF
jgi:hypothetical protein